MTAPMLMTDCPTEETLAAFIDDRLDAPTRRKVTEHVAGCGECRELVMMATDFQESEAPAKVVRGKFGWIAPAAALVAAAVIAIFVLPPLFEPDMEDVAASSRSLDYRPGLGRSAGALSHKPVAPTYRSGNETTSIGLEKAELLGIAAEAKDPYVLGVALFLTAENGEGFKEAADQLSVAYEDASRKERDAIAIDLSAALIAYSSWTNDNKVSERALELSEGVWERTRIPQAAWNRAAALEKLGRNEEAIRAWDDYLKLDPNSSWAKEAEERQKDLRELTN